LEIGNLNMKIKKSTAKDPINVWYAINVMFADSIQKKLKLSVLYDVIR